MTPTNNPNANPASQPLVLVVDDAPDLGLIVQRLARRAGHEVAVCPDVAGGWAFLQERRPDLTLVDVNLPGPSGLELCQRIRATPGLADLPLALFGNWGLQRDVLAGLQAGVDFVIDKELLPRTDAWQTRLREILAWNHGRHAARLLSWLEQVAHPEPPEGWATLLNQALRHASLRPLRPQVLRFLLWRSLRRVVPPRVPDRELESWLLAEAVLAADRLPPSLGVAEGARVDGVFALVVSLAEQLWCLLGTEASAPVWAALGPLVPGLEKCLLS